MNNGDTGTQQAPEGSWKFTDDNAAKTSAGNQPQPNPQPADAAPTPLQQSPPQSSQALPMDAMTQLYSEDEQSLLYQTVPQEISWTASEYADHQKSVVWYIGLAGVTLIMSAIAYFIVDDLVSVVAVIAFAIVFGVVAGYKPKIVSYHLDSEGVQINQRKHSFSDFKSFSVQRDGAFPSITFIPMRRFMPPTVVYFPPEHGQDVLDVLARYLPEGQLSQGPVDQLLRHIRF